WRGARAMSETKQWVERFEALRDDLATGDLYHVQKWVQNDGALTEIAEGIARLTAERDAARERERSVRDEATGYLAEISGMLADMHGDECRFEGGAGCLACYAQGRIAEMQDALAAAPLEKWTHNHGGEQ